METGLQLINRASPFVVAALPPTNLFATGLIAPLAFRPRKASIRQVRNKRLRKKHRHGLDPKPEAPKLNAVFNARLLCLRRRINQSLHAVLVLKSLKPAASWLTRSDLPVYSSNLTIN